MSADHPQPRPSFLGVGEEVPRRTRNPEVVGSSPTAQTISQPMGLHKTPLEFEQMRRELDGVIGGAFRVPARFDRNTTR